MRKSMGIYFQQFCWLFCAARKNGCDGHPNLMLIALMYWKSEKWIRGVQGEREMRDTLQCNWCIAWQIFHWHMIFSILEWILVLQFQKKEFERIKQSFGIFIWKILMIWMICELVQLPVEMRMLNWVQCHSTDMWIKTQPKISDYPHHCWDFKTCPHPRNLSRRFPISN